MEEDKKKGVADEMDEVEEGIGVNSGEGEGVGNDEEDGSG